MNGENDTKPDGSGSASESEAAPSSDRPADSWDAIGRQLNEIGSSIAAMGRAIAEDPDVRRHAREVKSRLEALSAALGDSIDAAADSDEGRRLRENADRAAESVAAAGAQVVDSVGPHVAAALESANETLRSMAERMEQRSADKAEAPQTESSSDEAAVPPKEEDAPS